MVLPALLTALVVAALALRLFSSPDPMFLLSLLLSNATPTAINIQVGRQGGVAVQVTAMHTQCNSAHVSSS